MNPVWEITLPQSPLLEGWSRVLRRQDGVVTDEMELGPDSERVRSTAVGYDVTATFKMTSAQRDTFEAYYNNVLKYGVQPFDWNAPPTGVTRAFKMREYDENYRHPFYFISCNLLELPV